MFEDLTKFIAENYPKARKIVEVGVGHRIDVALDIKKRLPNAEVIVTDKDASWVRSHRTGSVKAVVDDVVNPRLVLYQSAGLIYSLHPPVELIPSLLSLAKSVGADLLVVPVMDEREAFEGPEWRMLVRTGRTIGWLWSPRRD